MTLSGSPTRTKSLRIQKFQQRGHDFHCRMSLLDQLEQDSSRTGAEYWTRANRKVYGKAARMITSLDGSL